MTEENRVGPAFTQTRWSLVVMAARQEDANSRAALTWLCERYWFPLFVHARGHGNSPEDAEDLVQSFFEHLIAKNTVKAADAGRGRFRFFLLTCFDHFISHEWRRGQRLKRGGGVEMISLDGKLAEALFQREIADAGTPALDFDRVWALTLLDRVMQDLRNECDADGKEGRFEVLRVFIQGERGEFPFTEAAERLGLSVPAVKSTVSRLRTRFRELVRAEIRECVSSDEEVDGELEYLFSALTRQKCKIS